MNGETESSSPMPIIVGIVVVLIVFGIVFWQVSSQYSTYEYDRLKEKIDTKTNVTDDYRQGWIDCIEELKNIRTEVTNVTSQMN